MTTVLAKHSTGVIALFLLDQLSKQWLRLHQTDALLFQHDVISLSIRASLNHELAFSIPAPQWLIYAIVMPLLAIVGALWVSQAKAMKPGAVWLTLILAGALGNLFDRLVLGGVVDFVELAISQFSWSSFNLADLFIVIGILGWIYSESFPSRSLENN